MIWLALLGLLVQGAITYVAIRLALVHDRAAPGKDADREAAAAARRTTR